MLVRPPLVRFGLQIGCACFLPQTVRKISRSSTAAELKAKIAALPDGRRPKFSIWHSLA